MTFIQYFNHIFCDAPMCNPFRWLKMKQCGIEKWWHVKTPPEKWDFIIGIGKMSGNAIGVHIFDSVKIFWFTFGSGVLLLIFFSLDIYTIQYYWLRGAFVRSLESTYVVGFVIGVCLSTKLFCFFFQKIPSFSSLEYVDVL